MTTRGKAESFICGAIAMESSRLNWTGRSLPRLRRIASGMRGPSAARAKIKTVSPGATFPASSGATVTTPLTRPPPGACAGFAICVLAPGERPSERACAMLACTLWTMSDSAGRSPSTRSQWRTAEAPSLRLKAAVPASSRAFTLLGSTASARRSLGIGFAGLAEALEHRVRTPQHHPALGVLGVLFQARRQPRDHRLELLRAYPVRICSLRALRQEGAGIADRYVDGEGADRHGQTQCKRSGARGSLRVRQGVALADIGQQSRFDIAARFFMLVRGQCSGAQVGFELAQLIAVYRDIDRIARFA